MRHCRCFGVLMVLASLLLDVTHSAIASTPQFVSSKIIHNQAQTLTQLKKQTALPVIFPAIIPVVKKGQQLYASSSSYGINADYNKFWQINIDATPDCQGAKVCNIGYITAEKNGKLTRQYQTLPGNKVSAKQTVLLKNNNTGYYTPFHIQAGGVNPTLEWKVGNILYTLSWRVNAHSAQQKQILTEMAKSSGLIPY